ncbi:hypothetical protein [Caulobacter soli]|uniref:hypothetical protein n=1 Tax=Caulobacter soli TaxID=2708539 RepID=UPI0013EB6618|nr:hypothetical protein [Caulobacter soli]
MRRLLVGLAALSLTACGPRPAEQAPICAIFALPAIPGDTRAGDASDLAWAKIHERALFKSGVIYRSPWQILAHGRSWGQCPVRPKPVENLLISRDGAYAMTKGGRRANGHPVSFGACYFENDPAGWRLRACRGTLNEPLPMIPQKR